MHEPGCACVGCRPYTPVEVCENCGHRHARWGPCPVLACRCGKEQGGKDEVAAPLP